MLLILFHVAHTFLCLCVEWGSSASGRRTAGKSLQTSRQIKKVKRVKLSCRGSDKQLHQLLLINPHSVLVFVTRLDEAAVAVQKEKNMYKEIENFPMCFKVSYRVGFMLTNSIFTIIKVRIKLFRKYVMFNFLASWTFLRLENKCVLKKCDGVRVLVGTQPNTC